MKGSLLTAEVLEPYAEALMSLAQSQNLVEQFGDNVATLLNLLEGSEELQQFLGNPTFKAEDKKAVLRQLVGDQVHPYMMNFLLILVDRRRILFLEGICNKFQDILRKLNQTVLAEVISAVPLSESQQQTIREKVLAMTSAREVELNNKVDPDLIGGVIIKVGSQVIDASLRGQLRRIGIQLSSAA
jgi:F-type H+-transporting ATPase subunit delta